MLLAKQKMIRLLNYHFERLSTQSKKQENRIYLIKNLLWDIQNYCGLKVILHK